MPEWVREILRLPLPLVAYALLLPANILSAKLAARHAYRLYRKGGSAEQAMHFLRTINRYANGATWGIIWYTTVVLVLPYAGIVGMLVEIIIAIAVPFILLGVILVVNHVILYRITMEIRRTTETLGEGLKRKLRMFFLDAVPLAIIWLLLLPLAKPAAYTEPRNVSIGGDIAGIIFLTLFLLLISWVTSWFIPLALKATRIRDKHPYGHIFEFARKAKIKKLKIYIWPGIKSKDANAMVSGLLRRKLFISDYLLERFSRPEIESVLGHEIGHYKRKHLWFHPIFIVGFVTLILTISQLMSNYLEGMPIALSFPLIMAVATLYLKVVVNYVKRIHERQADAYAIELGVQPMVSISALWKLAKLSHSLMQMPKADEKLQTHPPIGKRIKWIMDAHGISWEEFREREIEWLREVATREDAPENPAPLSLL